MKRINITDELILNHFVENESDFSGLKYIISFYDYLKKKDAQRNGNFWIFDGRHIVLTHIIKFRQYFGNIKLIKCSPFELSENDEFQRTILINQKHLFLKAMLFVQAEGETYRLRNPEGYLELSIPLKQTIKIL